MEEYENEKRLSVEEYLLANPEVPVNMVNRCFDAISESKKYSYELSKLQMENEYRITKIVEKYSFYKEALSVVYGERFRALDAQYKVLDKALENNDREVILEALRSISSIVASNPLSSFVEFSRIMKDDNETLYLDF